MENDGFWVPMNKILAPRLGLTRFGRECAGAGGRHPFPRNACTEMQHESKLELGTMKMKIRTWQLGTANRTGMGTGTLTNTIHNRDCNLGTCGNHLKTNTKSILFQNATMVNAMQNVGKAESPSGMPAVPIRRHNHARCANHARWRFIRVDEGDHGRVIIAHGGAA